MTASDVRTSVNSVGAVEGNKAADNSEARCPIKRWGLRASRRGIQVPTWKGTGVGVCWWPHQVASGPWPCLVTGSLGYFGVGMGRRGTGVLGPSGIWLQGQQLERVPSLWISTCRHQQGERNADSALLGGGVRFDLSEGRSGNAYPSHGNVHPSGPITPSLRISPKERDSSVKS